MSDETKDTIASHLATAAIGLLLGIVIGSWDAATTTEQSQAEVGFSFSISNVSDTETP